MAQSFILTLILLQIYYLLHIMRIKAPRVTSADVMDGILFQHKASTGKRLPPLGFGTDILVTHQHVFLQDVIIAVITRLLPRRRKSIARLTKQPPFSSINTNLPPFFRALWKMRNPSSNGSIWCKVSCKMM